MVFETAPARSGKDGEAVEPARISVDEVKKRIDRGEPILVLDNRNPTAWAESRVKIGWQGCHRHSLTTHDIIELLDVCGEKNSGSFVSL